MNITEAQANMRHAFLGGAPGLAISAAVWLLAGIISAARDPQSGILVLILGGMLIHPFAVIASKVFGRPGGHSKRNPLGRLAIENTVILLLGVFLAFVLSRFRVELFFSAMLIVIGGRYLTFQTLYGRRVYWLCGIVLAFFGSLAAMFSFPAAATACGGALVEAAFAAIVFAQSRREHTNV